MPCAHQQVADLCQQQLAHDQNHKLVRKENQNISNEGDKQAPGGAETMGKGEDTGGNPSPGIPPQGAEEMSHIWSNPLLWDRRGRGQGDLGSTAALCQPWGSGAARRRTASCLPRQHSQDKVEDEEGSNDDEGDEVQPVPGGS